MKPLVCEFSGEPIALPLRTEIASSNVLRRRNDFNDVLLKSEAEASEELEGAEDGVTPSFHAEFWGTINALRERASQKGQKVRTSPVDIGRATESTTLRVLDALQQTELQSAIADSDESRKCLLRLYHSQPRLLGLQMRDPNFRMEIFAQLNVSATEPLSLKSKGYATGDRSLPERSLLKRLRDEGSQLHGDGESLPAWKFCRTLAQTYADADNCIVNLHQWQGEKQVRKPAVLGDFQLELLVHASEARKSMKIGRKARPIEKAGRGAEYADMEKGFSAEGSSFAKVTRDTMTELSCVKRDMEEDKDEAEKAHHKKDFLWRSCNLMGGGNSGPMELTDQNGIASVAESKLGGGKEHAEKGDHEGQASAQEGS